jgi:GcrA cell cycle regulator
MVKHSTWTDQQSADLRRMWDGENLPVPDIAHALGMNKNQVVGKAHRMGLQSKRQSGGRPKARKNAPPVGKREVHDLAPLAIRTCRYPHGDPRTPGFRFCGGAVMLGKPYCASHMAVTYTQYRSRREAQRVVEARIGGALKAIEREAREMKG